MRPRAESSPAFLLANRGSFPLDLFLQGTHRLALSLSDGQTSSFQCYFEEILRWNKKVHLTGYRRGEEIIRFLFLDSLLLLPYLPSPTAKTLDIGSGAGIPGAVLGIAAPSLSVRLVESNRKRANFLRHIVRTCRISTVEVLQERAELLAKDPSHTQSYDLVVARAVTSTIDAVSLASPFVKEGGRLLIPLPRVHSEIVHKLHALALRDWAARVEKVSLLSPLEIFRTLLIMDKV